MKKRIVSKRKWILGQAFIWVLWAIGFYVALLLKANAFTILAFIPMMAWLVIFHAFFDTPPKPKPVVKPLAEYYARKLLDKYHIKIHRASDYESMYTNLKGVEALYNTIFNNKTRFVDLKDIDNNDDRYRWVNVDSITYIEKIQQEERGRNCSGKSPEEVEKELDDFVKKGYEVIRITPNNPEATAEVNRLREKYNVKVE